MGVSHRLIEMMYKGVREEIINVLINEHKFSQEIAIGIVDYENDETIGYNQVKDLMEQDLIRTRAYNITAMAEKILDNDEGRYQSTIKLV